MVHTKHSILKRVCLPKTEQKLLIILSVSVLCFVWTTGPHDTFPHASPYHNSVVFYMQMANLAFNFEIHHGGKSVWNIELVYLAASTFVVKVDPDRLSYFEVQDICFDVRAVCTSTYHYLIPGGNLEQGLRLINGDDDVVCMCEIHATWLTDKITLYVEGGEEPLTVEQPFGNEEVANDDEVHEVRQSDDDDVTVLHEGGNVDAEGGGGEDFD